MKHDEDLLGTDVLVAAARERDPRDPVLEEAAVALRERGGSSSS